VYTCVLVVGYSDIVLVLVNKELASPPIFNYDKFVELELQRLSS